jgi:hypothetical protein
MPRKPPRLYREPLRGHGGRPEVVMNLVKIAEVFYYLHTQDKSRWTHEPQLTPFATKPSL